MFKVNSVVRPGLKYAIRFQRNGQDSVTCEIKSGPSDWAPKDLITLSTETVHRYHSDTFDKGRGFLYALQKAVRAASISRDDSRRIFSSFAEWAKSIGMNTEVNLDLVGK